MRYLAMRYQLLLIVALILMPGLLLAGDISTLWDEMIWDGNARWYSSDLTLVPTPTTGTTTPTTTDKTKTTIALAPANTTTTARLTSAVSTTTQDTTGLYLTIGNSGKLPIGTITLQVDGAQASVETPVAISLPQGVNVNRVMKYGATPDNRTAHWYDFTCDSNGKNLVKPCGEITVVQGQKTVTLYLIDGQKGDDDLTVNGVIKDDVAFATLPEVTCQLPVVVTAVVDTWCAVTNGSGNDSTMTFTMLGFHKADYTSTLPSISISASNSLKIGETAVYFFQGRNVYKGFNSSGTVVVNESDMAALPSGGPVVYAAKLSVASNSASTTNILMQCYQLDAYGAKRSLPIKCY
jgi:hypothetical protein